MVVILLLLVFKPALHGFVKKLQKEELHAIILFVIMSALVIPFLPDKMGLKPENNIIIARPLKQPAGEQIDTHTNPYA